MKQKNIISIITALLLSVSMMITVISCSHTDEKNFEDAETIKKENADSILKGTSWAAEKPYLMFASFDKEENIMNFSIGSARYRINGMSISFDLSGYVNKMKNMTLEQRIELQKEGLKKAISALEKSLEQAQDELKIKQTQQLAKIKEDLKSLENPSQEIKDEFAEGLKKIKEKDSLKIIKILAVHLINNPDAEHRGIKPSARIKKKQN